MTDKIIVLTTAGSKDEAHKIGRTLVERLLAACVNVVPRVTSIYRWQGQIEEAEEWLLIVKTTRSAFDQVRDAIVSLHSYQVRNASVFRSTTAPRNTWIGLSSP